MSRNLSTPLWRIGLILSLYFLQGMNIGIASSIPLFLVAYGATWKDQGTFGFCLYPFSLKLLWAPLIDAIYSRHFGRRKSWLVPIQFSTGVIFLILSFFIESLIVQRYVIWLTIIFFGIIFLTATQDICVDGLAITLFTATNIQWASTSQTVGQNLGRFFGFSFLLTFESANFTNRFVRKPLSIEPKNTGLFSIERFVQFAAVGFLIFTVCLTVFFREKEIKKEEQEQEEQQSLSLRETYLSIVKLFKKKCVRDLTLVSLLAPIGMAATNYMTRVRLMTQGVPRTTLALISIPVSLISIIGPILIRDTDKPLVWFKRSYILFLITSIPLAIYVFYTPSIISAAYYYPVLIVILACNEFIMTLRFSAQCGFYAFVSEPRIGGTYMTLLVTLHNLGFAVNSSIVLYIAEWLPKKYAYVIAVGACLIIGIIWLICSTPMLKRLQNLPKHEWYLVPTDETNQSNEQQAFNESLIDKKTID